MDYGLLTVDRGLWTMDYGLWTMDYGLLTVDRGLFNSFYKQQPPASYHLPPYSR